MNQMPKTITTYSLAELETVRPEAYERVHERWKAGISEVAWTDETMACLRACIEACGARLTTWEIGTDSGWLNVEVEDTNCDDDSDGTAQRNKDAAWLFENVLQPLGYTRDHAGKVKFPGNCPWTGYCADEDFIEAVYKALESGDTLTKALQGLASVASRLMQNDLEQQQDTESMMMNWRDNQYTIEGTEV